MCIREYTTQEDIVSSDVDFAVRRSYLSFGGYLHQQAHCSDDGADGSQKQPRGQERDLGEMHVRVRGEEGQFPLHCLSTLAIIY